MIPETFADGIGRAGFSGGVVRLDLVSFALGEPSEDGKPKREPRHRILLSPQAFLETYAAMESMIEKLVELGVLRRQQGEGAAGLNVADQPPAAKAG